MIKNERITLSVPVSRFILYCHVCFYRDFREFADAFSEFDCVGLFSVRSLVLFVFGCLLI